MYIPQMILDYKLFLKFHMINSLKKNKETFDNVSGLAYFTSYSVPTFPLQILIPLDDVHLKFLRWLNRISFYLTIL